MEPLPEKKYWYTAICLPPGAASHLCAVTLLFQPIVAPRFSPDVHINPSVAFRTLPKACFVRDKSLGQPSTQYLIVHDSSAK
jgi:hypothetical protein